MKSNKPTPSGGNKQPTAPPHDERVIAAADVAESLVNEPQDVFEARLHNIAKDHKVSRDEILVELANCGVQLSPDPEDALGERAPAGGHNDPFNRKNALALALAFRALGVGVRFNIRAKTPELRRGGGGRPPRLAACHRSQHREADKRGFHAILVSHTGR